MRIYYLILILIFVSYKIPPSRSGHEVPYELANLGSGYDDYGMSQDFHSFAQASTAASAGSGFKISF